MTRLIGRTVRMQGAAVGLLLAGLQPLSASATSPIQLHAPRFDVHRVRFKVVKAERTHCHRGGKSVGFALKLRVRHASQEGIDSYGTVDNGNPFDRYEAYKFIPISNHWTHWITYHRPVDSQNPLIAAGRVGVQDHLNDDLSGYAFPTLKVTLPAASSTTCR